MRRNRTAGGFRRGAVLAATGATALAMVATGAASSGASAAHRTPKAHHAKSAGSGSITVALDETFPGFNVLTSADNNYDLQQLIENVWPMTFITTPKLTLVPNTQLLTSVTQTSKSPQTIVYKINPKATWSDGVPITAADFIYNWHAQSGLAKYKDKGGKPFDVASTAGYNQIKSVTGSNGGRTVTVVFKTPFADWKSLFAPIAPAHIAEKASWNTGFNNIKNVVSGSWYTISGYKQNQFLTLKANPKYWSTPAKIKTVNFQWVSSDDSEPTGLQNGELNVIAPASVSESLILQANRVPNTVHQTIPGLEFEHFDFNGANPYLAKLKVRQAIAYGTNRPQIIADTVGPILRSTKPLGNRIFLPNQPGYVNNGKAYDKQNVQKARSLLESLGFKLVGSYFEPNYGPEAGQPLTFTIQSTTGNAIRSETEQLFQAQMAQVGIKINIQNYDAATLFGKNLPGGQYDIGEFAWVATPFPSGNQSIYCSYTLGNACGSNWIHFANKTVDALMAAGSSATSPQAEINDYNRADAVLWDQMATLPLYQKPQYYAWSNNIQGIQPNASNSGITWNLPDWSLKG